MLFTRIIKKVHTPYFRDMHRKTYNPDFKVATPYSHLYIFARFCLVRVYAFTKKRYSSQRLNKRIQLTHYNEYNVAYQLYHSVPVFAIEAD